MIVGNAGAEGEGDESAAVFLKAGGSVHNRSEVGGDGAVVFGAAGDVVVDAGGDVLNTNARIVSNKKLSVRAGGEARNESLHVGPEREVDSDRRRRLGGVLRGHRYEVDRGELADPGHHAYWVAEEGLSVEARSISNVGGHIIANNGDMHLTATDGLLNRALAVGEFSYERSCMLFFCHTEARSSEQLVGGEISGGGEMHLKAGTAIDNEGGRILSIGRMQLDAPVTRATGSPIHIVLRRDEGLKAFFGDTWASLYAVDQGGSFTAQEGRMILYGEGIQNHGAFTAKEGVEGTITVVHAPERDAVIIDDHLGVVRW